MPEEGKKKTKDNLSGFVCETEPIEDGIQYHFLHNPTTGEWRRSRECVN